MTSGFDTSVQLHLFDDLDQADQAHHHSLGSGFTQSSPGNHSHNGDARNGIVLPQGSVSNLVTDLAGKSPSSHNHDTHHSIIGHAHTYLTEGGIDGGADISTDLLNRFRQRSSDGVPQTSNLTNCTVGATGTLVQPDSLTDQAKIYACQFSYTLNANAGTASGIITIPAGMFTATPIFFLTPRITISAAVRFSSPTTTQLSWGMYIPTPSASSLAFFLDVLAVGR